jgi:hypothetical protein
MRKKLFTISGTSSIGMFIVWSIICITWGVILFISLTPKETSYNEISLTKIKELQDCQMLAIETDGDKIYVIRCPNSDVSLHWTRGSKNYFIHTTEGKI